MQSIAETCVCFDAAHLSINLVSEIAVPMFPTLTGMLCTILIYQPRAVSVNVVVSVIVVSLERAQVEMVCQSTSCR